MRIPVYIEEMLKSRALAARRFVETDAYITEWLAKNGIDAPPGDVGLGADALFDPEHSNEVIRECIRGKEK